MSAAGPVIDSYQSGIQAMKENKYARAARYFLVCHYYYEYGDMGIYLDIVFQYGTDSMSKFYDCKEKLTNEERYSLHKLYQRSKGLDWKKKANLIYDEIIADELAEQNNPSGPSPLSEPIPPSEQLSFLKPSRRKKSPKSPSLLKRLRKFIYRLKHKL